MHVFLVHVREAKASRVTRYRWQDCFRWDLSGAIALCLLPFVAIVLGAMCFGEWLAEKWTGKR